MRSTAFWLCVAAIVSVRDAAAGISRKVSCFKPPPQFRTTATSATTTTTTTNQPSFNIDLLSTLPWRNDTLQNGTDDSDDQGATPINRDQHTPQPFDPYLYRRPQGGLMTRRGYIEPDEELWDEEEEEEEREPRYRGNNFGIMGNNLRAEGNNNGWTSNRPGGMGNRGWYREADEEEFEIEDEEEGPRSGHTRNPWSGNRNWGGPVNAVNARSSLGLSRTPTNGWTGNSRWRRQESDRKRRQVAVVSGKVSCDPFHKIRIVQVTVGYSHDGVCDSRRPRCRREATLDEQVALCDGAQTCDLSYEQTPFAECPRAINFVTAEYDCLPDDSTFGICDLTITSKIGPVVVTSPGYPGGTAGKAGEFMTCECVLRTEPNSSITVSALTTNMAGNETLCTEDMLLMEMKTNPEAKKFKVVGELCGKTRRDAQPFASNVIRMTYLTEIPAVADRTGFRGIFEAHGPNATPAALLMTCRDISAVPAITEQQTQPSNAQSARRPVTSAPSVVKTTASIASAGGVGAVMGGAGSEPVKDASAGAIPGGVLSGVVASLVSIIAIMVSVFVYLLYRRSQRKKMRKFRQQSGGRGESWYNDPTYNEAAYSEPDPPAIVSQPEKPAVKTLVDSATYTASQEITPTSPATTEKAAPSTPPPLPSAPPRRNRKRQPREDVVYDNAHTEDDYASLSDVYNNANVN